MSRPLFTPGLHIIAADHGVGNTITALNIAAAVANGQPIFGRETHMPAKPAAWFSLKSSPPRGVLPANTHIESDETVSHQDILALGNQYGVIVLDPAHLAMTSGSINATNEVADHFDKIRKAAIAIETPVLLVHFLTKFTRGLARERIAGCAFWTTSMRTHTTIERYVNDPADPRRKLIHYPAGAAPILWDFAIQTDGSWVEIDGGANLESFFCAVEPGSTVHTQDFLTIGEDDNLSRATIMRWLSRVCADGRLQKVKGVQGAYFKPRVN